MLIYLFRRCNETLNCSSVRHSSVSASGLVLFHYPVSLMGRDALAIQFDLHNMGIMSSFALLISRYMSPIQDVRKLHCAEYGDQYICIILKNDNKYV